MRQYTTAALMYMSWAMCEALSLAALLCYALGPWGLLVMLGWFFGRCAVVTWFQTSERELAAAREHARRNIQTLDQKEGFAS